LSGGGSPEVEIARLELRVDNADKDIAELKADLKEDREHARADREKDRAEVSELRRALAWLMGAAVIVGAILSQLLVTGFTLIRESLK
jgi:hypothetical protein